VKENEQADRPAVISNGHAMDQADDLPTICKLGRLADSLEDGGAKIIARLREVKSI
jgi:hypothetical protein